MEIWAAIFQYAVQPDSCHFVEPIGLDELAKLVQVTVAMPVIL